MIKFPIKTKKLLGEKIIVDKNVTVEAKRGVEQGYTRYHASSKEQPEGFEIRVEGSGAPKPTRRQEAVLTGAKATYVRNRTAKGKYVYEYVVYAESLKLV
ncbi:hypothetical protein [Lactococcus petauri]|uniref:hypothetical protein n=1 Tax=Lactococcus petauri TaxID=1940789 RepID=UPI003267ED78